MDLLAPHSFVPRNPRNSAMKPKPGHKCLGATPMFRVKCECGWESALWGQRSAAYREWRWHRDQPHKTMAEIISGEDHQP